MDKIKFSVIKRVSRPVMQIIHAMAENPGCVLTIYLDSETGKPMYPITIEQAVSGVAITLNSDEDAGCSFPPSVSEQMIDGIITYLNMFHDIVLAARKQIREEQELFLSGNQ